MTLKASHAFLLIMATVAGFPGAARADAGTLDKIRSAGTITLGYRESSVPFSYLDASQKPVGFSIDLCNAIADQVKAVLKLDKLAVAYAPVNASNRIPLLQNGAVDIECGSTTNSVERAKQVAFSLTTFVSQPRWLVTVASGIRDTKGFAGKTIVMTQGSLSLPIGEKINADEKLGFTVAQAKDHGESLLMLRTGRAVGWFEEDILLAGLKAVSPTPSAFRYLPELYGTYYRDGLMLRKDDTAFKAVVDGVIRDKMASGEFAKLYDKWFTAPVPPSGQNLDLPMSDALKALVASPSDAPTP